MRVLVALNGFKGSTTAVEATRWVAQGLRVALPDQIEVCECPVCDGGSGFCEMVTLARGGTIETELNAHDAALRLIDNAKIGWFDDESLGKTAVIEAADTVGLDRLKEKEDEQAAGIMERSSRGLGEILSHAHRGGARKVLIGCGDSAIQDCGVGLLEVLGAMFHDRDNQQLEDVRTKDLCRIARITFKRPDNFPEVELACNLSSVLVGSAATVRTYAKQKGATSEEIEELARGTTNIAEVFARAFGREVSRDFGSGANGGVGAALMAALDATSRYSFHTVNEAIGLSEALEHASVVVVGEGKLDKGTVRGKAPGAVALLAAKFGVPAVAVAGSVEQKTFGKLLAANIVSIQTLSHPDQQMKEYIKPENAPTLLREAGVRLAPTIHMLCRDRGKHANAL